MERLDKDRRRVVFSLQYVKENGEKIEIPSAVCTSTFNANDTANIKLLPSQELRTVSFMGIVRFNDEEVFV